MLLFNAIQIERDWGFKMKFSSMKFSNPQCPVKFGSNKFILTWEQWCYAEIPLNWGE